MKTLFLAIILLLGCVKAQNESIEQYAGRLQNIIISGDTGSFAALSCFPSECVDKSDIDYVFGKSNSDGSIKSFLSQFDIKIKVFGPYQYSDRPGHNEYLLMYYDPSLVKFNSDGYLSSYDREKLWWKGYVETVVTQKDDKWVFYRTPFYYGAHLPWAEDY